jgi:hypothetical protein
MLTSSVEPAFGGTLFPLFRHDAGGMWFVSQRYRQHFLGRRHFEIQRQIDRMHDAGDIVVANMPAVFAEMSSYTVAAHGCHDLGCPYWIGMIAAARVPDRRDMVDVDPQTQRREVGHVILFLAAAGLDRRNCGELGREVVGIIYRKIERNERVEGNAKIRLSRRAINQCSFSQHDAAFGAHSLHRLPGGKAGGDNILHQQHLLTGLYGKTAPQRKFAIGSFEEDGIDAQRAAHFMTDDQSAHGRGNNKIDVGTKFARQCLYKRKRQTARAISVHEYARAL